MKNLLKQRLFAGEPCFGTWITIGNPDIVDILKRFPFDWFLFDMEHSCMSFNDVKTMMQALGGGGASPIIRIGEIDQLQVKRALDAGGEGLLVPLVNSREEAQRVIDYSMYPPDGIRGAGPGRATGFGTSMGEYIRSANQEILLAVQIETISALSVVDEILGMKGIDLGFVGPTDLTISLGLLDDRSSPKVIEAMEKVIRSCNHHGKIPGTLAVSVEEARKFRKLGFQFIGLASDSRFLSYGARSYLEAKG